MINANKLIGYDGCFATRLREIMKLHAHTQSFLAKILGVSRQSVSQYADGTALPTIEKLFKIATCYGVSADYLLGIVDVQSSDINIQSMSATLGLSELVIERLKELQFFKNRPDKKVANHFANLNFEFYNFLLKDDTCNDLFSEIKTYANLSFEICKASEFKKELKTAIKENVFDINKYICTIDIKGQDELYFSITPEEAKYAILAKISDEFKKIIEYYTAFKIKNREVVNVKND